MDQNAISLLVEHAIADSGDGNAVLWAMSTRIADNEARLSQLDVVCPPDAHGVRWHNGKGWLLVEITSGVDGKQKYAALRPVGTATPPVLTKSCGNLYIEEDGYCPKCGQYHSRTKPTRARPAGGDKPRQGKRSLEDFKRWQMEMLKKDGIPLSNSTPRPTRLGPKPYEDDELE